MLSGPYGWYEKGSGSQLGWLVHHVVGKPCADWRESKEVVHFHCPRKRDAHQCAGLGCLTPESECGYSQAHQWCASWRAGGAARERAVRERRKGT